MTTNAEHHADDAAPPAPPDGYAITAGGAELLERVAPLWYELRSHHAAMAPSWRDGLMAASFADRKAGLLRKSGDDGLLVLPATFGGTDAVIGYCVCTVAHGGRGEVDSVYVTAGHRGRGLG